MAQVAVALGDRRGALGPEVGWTQAALSLSRARLALEVVPGGFVLAEEHLADLLLAADRKLANELADRVLAPLDDAPESCGSRLTETLEAWLDHQGRVEAVAQALDIHPQTVRYDWRSCASASTGWRTPTGGSSWRSRCARAASHEQLGADPDDDADEDHREQQACKQPCRRRRRGRGCGRSDSISACRSTSRAVIRPDAGTSTSRRPAARKSGTSEPRARRRSDGTPSSRSIPWIISASA